MAHTVPSPSPTLGPITARERILTLDVLRGIALFGVLAANSMDYSGYFLVESTQEATLSVLDKVVNFLMHGLVQGKAWRTFSFLFGLGFAVQMLRAEASGVAIASRYRRRLAVLFAFGVLHATLLWYGDILNQYALLGFLLLLFRHRSDRALVTWAVTLWGVAIVLFAAPDLVRAMTGAPAPTAEYADLFARILAGFQNGSYAQIGRSNLLELWRYYAVRPTTEVVGEYFQVFGFFLLGLWAGRRRVFEEVSAHRTLLRRAVWVALPVGVAAYLVTTVLPRGPEWEGAPWFVLLNETLSISGRTLTAFGYIAAATLLLERERWRRWLSAFAPVGRMALTNYLAQSVFCTTIYYSTGLVGRSRPVVSVGIAVAVFLVQMLYSRWWLEHFRFGPMEWVWRSLTYARLQPMRRALEPGERGVPELAR